VVELKVLNTKHASEWARYARAPARLFARDYKLNPCDGCEGTCCHFIVQVSALEATRIALTLVIPPEDMFEAHPFEVDDASGQPATHPIELAEGPVSLRLRRDADSRACVFKIEIGGRGRCGAYMLRPGQCRFYPWTVEEADGNVIHTGNDEHCPTGWLHDDGTAARLGDELARWREALAQDATLCAKWNEDERPAEERTFDAFFRFAAAELAPGWGLDPTALYPPPRRRLGSRST
jgi:Fe-S-cluster containining protein